MNCQALQSPARALFTVFVQPCSYLRSPTRFARPLTPALNATASLVQARCYAARNFKFVPNKDELYAIRDEAIRSKFVAFRDIEGQFHHQVPLRDLLSSLDRTKYHVVQLKERDPKDPSSLPICAVLSEDQIVAEKKQQRQQEKERKRKARLLEPKEVQINWGSDKNDVEIKLKRMVEFLRQGRRVMVALSPKKRKTRNWTPAEAADLVRVIRERTAEAEGSKEYKKAEGKLGQVLYLYFEGRELPKGEGGEGAEGSESSEAAP